MKGIALFFASKLHEEERYKKPLNVMVKAVSPFSDGIYIFRKVLKSREEVEEALQELTFKPRFAVFFALTGGVSRLIREAANLIDGPKLLVGYEGNNSFPSVLSAFYKLKKSGQKVVLHFMEAGNREGKGELEKDLMLCRGLAALAEEKLLILAKRLNVEQLRKIWLFTRNLGVKVVVKGLSELARTFSEVDGREVNSCLAKISNIFVFSQKEDEGLKKAVKLYLSLRKLLNGEQATSVTLECFDLLKELGVTPCLAYSLLIGEGVTAGCELDLDSTATMLLLQKTLEQPVFMANINAIDTERNTITLSHCTAAFNLSRRKPELLPHFESGLPLSVRVYLREGRVTLAKLTLSRRKTTLTVITGELEKSGAISNVMCRTQAIVKTDKPVKKLLHWLPGNHLVLVYGDHTETLRKLAVAVKAQLSPP